MIIRGLKAASPFEKKCLLSTVLNIFVFIYNKNFTKTFFVGGILLRAKFIREIAANELSNYNLRFVAIVNFYLETVKDEKGLNILFHIPITIIKQFYR